jgi:hypothetical protein
MVDNLYINIPGILSIEKSINRNGNLCVSDGNIEEWIKINWDEKCVIEVKDIINTTEYTAKRCMAIDKSNRSKKFEPRHITDNEILKIVIDERKTKKQYIEEARKSWELSEAEKLRKMVSEETNKDFSRFKKKFPNIGSNKSSTPIQQQPDTRKPTIVRSVAKPITDERKVGNEMIKLEESLKKEANEILIEYKQIENNV